LRSVLSQVLDELRAFLIAEGAAQRLVPPLLNITSRAKPGLGTPSLIWRVVNEEQVNSDGEMQARILMSVTLAIPDAEFQQNTMLDYSNDIRRAITRFTTGTGKAEFEYDNTTHGMGKAKDGEGPLAVAILDYRVTYYEESEAV